LRQSAWTAGLEVYDCLFVNNSAQQGGAVQVQEEVGFIAEDCVFQGNAAPNGGGAVHAIGSSFSQIRRCVFKDNTGYQGGAIYARDQSSVRVEHCLITGNVVSQAGGAVGIYHDAVFTAVNCTVAGNSCSNLSGGIAWHSWGDLTLTNCILFNNPSKAHPDLRLSGKGTATVSFCCTPILREGIGNITDDPLFVDAQSGDYHLKSHAGRWDPDNSVWVEDDITSPCIDSGDPLSDWTQEPEPNGERINMGAYGGTPEASLSPN
jgi:parallel beta-helix repeat protein/predicted outer membrane repeat protein